MLESFNKAAGLQAKILQQSWFPVRIAKSEKRSNSKNIYERLLLTLPSHNSLEPTQSSLHLMQATNLSHEAAFPWVQVGLSHAERYSIHRY